MVSRASHGRSDDSARNERTVLAEPRTVGCDRTLYAEEPAGRVDDQRGNLGIIGVLQTGCRRIVTRYDKLGRNFLSAVAVATFVAF